MTDLALSKEGAQVTMATSFDDNYPPENVIDGKSDTFWVTTGLYPQEFIVALGSNSAIYKIATRTTNVKKFLCEKSESAQPVNFEKVFEVDLPHNGGKIQSHNNKVSKIVARYLKFVILSGWDEFASVHGVTCEGEPVNL